MHKKSIKGEITQKVLKQGLSFLCGTHCHDLFYVSVKYHQNIPNGIRVIERTRKCLRTDGCQAHRHIPQTFRSGDKKSYWHHRGGHFGNSCHKINILIL